MLNLILGLALLVSQGGLVFSHQRLDAVHRAGIVGSIRLQFVCSHHSHELIPLDLIAFFHQKLADLAADLRPDDHIFRRDYSRKDQRTRRLAHRVVGQPRATASAVAHRTDDRSKSLSEFFARNSGPIGGGCHHYRLWRRSLTFAGVFVEKHPSC